MKTLRGLPFEAGEGCPSVPACVTSWRVSVGALAARTWRATVEAVERERLPAPQGDAFVDLEGAPATLPDLRRRTAKAVDMCEECGASGASMQVQFGGRLHEARCAAIAVARCAVENGELTATFVEEAVAGREAADPPKEISRLLSRMKGARGPLAFDGRLEGHLRRLDEEVEAAGEVCASAENMIMAGMESDAGLASVQAGRADVLRATEYAKELRASVTAKFAAGLKTFEEKAMPCLVPAFEAELSKDAPGQAAMGSWPADPCVQLLPTLAPRYFSYLDAAERMGVDEEVVRAGRAAHRRMRVFVGVCHVTDRLFGPTSQKQPADRAEILREIKKVRPPCWRTSRLSSCASWGPGREVEQR